MIYIKALGGVKWTLLALLATAVMIVAGLGHQWPTAWLVLVAEALVLVAQYFELRRLLRQAGGQ